MLLATPYHKLSEEERGCDSSLNTTGYAPPKKTRKLEINVATYNLQLSLQLKMFPIFRLTAFLKCTYIFFSMVIT
jgi:hypothetical protein